MINTEPFNRPHKERLWPNYVFRAMSQTTGLPPLQCWQCKISIINWWLNKDNIPFPRRTHRLWSWSFSTAIFIRPQLAEQTMPPAGPVALVACLAPSREKNKTKKNNTYLVSCSTSFLFLTPFTSVLFGFCGAHAENRKLAGQHFFHSQRRTDVGLEWCSTALCVL